MTSPSRPRTSAATWRGDDVGAVVLARHHVGDPLDLGAGEDGAEKLDLARARLAVRSGDTEDRAVVFGDAVRAVGERLPLREVAVLVEDRRQFRNLGVERV